MLKQAIKKAKLHRLVKQLPVRVVQPTCLILPFVQFHLYDCLQVNWEAGVVTMMTV